MLLNFGEVENMFAILSARHKKMKSEYEGSSAIKKAKKKKRSKSFDGEIAFNSGPIIIEE